jgi:phage major head subunit gpT-like protein
MAQDPVYDPQAAQDACTDAFTAAAGPPQPGQAVTCPSCGHRFTVGEQPQRVTESTTAEAISGRRSTQDTRALLTKAVEDRVRGLTGRTYAYAYVRDFTDTDLVYDHDGKTWQCPYTFTEEGTVGTVTLGEASEVVEQTWYVPAAGGTPSMPTTEAAQVQQHDRIDGRVLEAKGTDETGGRVFRVRIIAAGDSKNRRRYPAAVLREAVALYEGAKAFDHHRSDEELRTSTIAGLVGSYRNVEADTAGNLDGDLHLLPGATHTAEALDASLAAQSNGLPALVGISHDVLATFKPVQAGGVRMQEATAIAKVNSADVVADPAAGGKAIRVVAGGTDTTTETDPAPAGQSTRESDVTVTSADVLAALQTATPEQLAAVGLSKAATTESTEPTPPPAPKPEPEPEKVTEAAGLDKTSFLGGLMVKQKVTDAGLPAAVAESLTASLPDRITESDVDNQIAALKSVLGIAERAGLAPTVTAQVTKESRDKKTAALDAFFAGDYAKGYRSFKEAFVDFTGRRPRGFDEDFNRIVLRESIGALYDSAVRAEESMDSTSWAQVLGDSITRRMVAEYSMPSLASWRLIVSSVVPISDFRTQRIERVGGYGVLPAVNEGAPYQPLTSPGDEEATYAITKRGGTEDVTLEMIANDDVRSIQRIPNKLGRAAAQTLYRFVWDILPTNAAVTYDSTALFHTNHGNTDSAALSQSNLSVGRRKLIEQTAYGDSSEVLAITPRYLVVPPELEELAWQLCTSAVALPASGNSSDIPNIHQANGLTPIMVPYYTDANDWYLVADPATVPTIEVGFYQGREQPELFTQADPNNGSMFNADKLTWKIRHIYGEVVEDHRGFYRGTQ